MSFILLLSLGNFHLGHHRIVTYGKQQYSFVPHSHAILHFLCFLNLLLFWVLLVPFFLNFYSGSSIHSVLLCERCIWLSAHGRRRTLAILYLNDSVLCFGTYCFHRSFWLLFAFWLSIFDMGSFIYNILFTLLPFRGSFAATP